VLHVTQPTEAGVGGFVSAVIADQSARGWSVTLASPDRANLPLAAREAGATFHPWPATRAPGPSVAVEVRRLKAILDSVRPDLVHLHASKAGLAGRLALRGSLPTIFQPNAWSFEALAGPLRTVAIAWERLSARWADVVVCVSAKERERGVAAGIRSEWRIIPNGVDLSALTEASNAERADARVRLGLPATPVAVCVGRLSRQKGQDVLLDAWPAVLKRVPSALLVLVGDGPDEARLRSLGSARVRFAGGRDDVPTWLAAADVVALPSRWEGMSFAMLEAMARGRSVVATDVGGAAEALGEEAGAVVPPEQPAPLADALAARLADPKKAAAEGRAGRLRAERSHSLAQSLDSIADLYREVRDGRMRRASSR
jgi:glycosyltransferase involved in cell wall biosynthesis